MTIEKMEALVDTAILRGYVIASQSDSRTLLRMEVPDVEREVVDVKKKRIANGVLILGVFCLLLIPIIFTSGLSQHLSYLKIVWPFFLWLFWFSPLIGAVMLIIGAIFRSQSKKKTIISGKSETAIVRSADGDVVFECSEEEMEKIFFEKMRTLEG